MTIRMHYVVVPCISFVLFGSVKYSRQFRRKCFDLWKDCLHIQWGVLNDFTNVVIWRICNIMHPHTLWWRGIMWLYCVYILHSCVKQPVGNNRLRAREKTVDTLTVSVMYICRIHTLLIARSFLRQNVEFYRLSALISWLTNRWGRQLF